MASIANYAMRGIAMLVAAIMIPLGMQQVVNAATTGWNAAVITMWQVLLPVLVIIAIAITFIPHGKGD